MRNLRKRTYSSTVLAESCLHDTPDIVESPVKKVKDDCPILQVCWNSEVHHMKTANTSEQQFTIIKPRNKCRCSNSSSNFPITSKSKYIKLVDCIEENIPTNNPLTCSHLAKTSDFLLKPATTTLTDDALIEVFRYLPTQQLLHVRSVCRQFCHVVNSYFMHNVRLFVNMTPPVASLEKNSNTTILCMDSVLPLVDGVSSLLQKTRTLYLHVNEQQMRAVPVKLGSFPQVRSLTIHGLPVRLCTSRGEQPLKDLVSLTIHRLPNSRCLQMMPSLQNLTLYTLSEGPLPNIIHKNLKILTLVQSVTPRSLIKCARIFPELQHLDISIENVDTLIELLRFPRLQLVNVNIAFHLLVRMHKNMATRLAMCLGRLFTEHKVSLSLNHLHLIQNVSQLHNQILMLTQHIPPSNTTIKVHRFNTSSGLHLWCKSPSRTEEPEHVELRNERRPLCFEILANFPELERLEIHASLPKLGLQSFLAKCPNLRKICLDMESYGNDKGTNLQFLFSLNCLEAIELKGINFDDAGAISYILNKNRFLNSVCIVSRSLTWSMYLLLIRQMIDKANHNPHLRFVIELSILPNFPSNLLALGIPDQIPLNLVIR